jgi:hypothetical protein
VSRFSNRNWLSRLLGYIVVLEWKFRNNHNWSLHLHLGGTWF